MDFKDVTVITVCVGYDDLLAITLPHTIHNFRKIRIVTSPEDKNTRDLVWSLSQIPNNFDLATVTTDAFYRNGAHFNKGLAIEEAFDLTGRQGWYLILDADIILPKSMPGLDSVEVGKLYSPVRRLLPNIEGYLIYENGFQWDTLTLRVDRGLYGYFQLFHADDPVLCSRPWYGVDWTHAGGCDNEFQQKWKANDKVRPPFEVLHLGDPDKNWFGRSTPRVGTTETSQHAENRRQLQESLKRKHGWGRPKNPLEPLEERIKHS